MARGDIKVASISEIEELSQVAASNHWSGQGRSAWMKEHGAEIARIFVTFIQEEIGPCFRCSVLVILNDRSGGHFAIDISPKRFRSLKNIDKKELTQLAHYYIQSFSHIPLDPEQKRKWNEG